MYLFNKKNVNATIFSANMYIIEKQYFSNQLLENFSSK